MKWNNNGVKYERGNYECLIARYDNDGAWFALDAIATQQTMKSEFKLLGEALKADTVEVKRLYDDSDNITETDIIVFDDIYGKFHFYVEHEDRLEKIPYPDDLEQVTHFFQD